jgi:hypothetical protein
LSQCGITIRAANPENASRFQDAEHLSEMREQVRKMFYDMMRVDRIDRGIAET